MQMQEALDRCEYAIKCQRTEIDRLRIELKRRDEELTQLLAWIDGDSDALVVLQRTYMDPRTSTSDSASGLVPRTMTVEPYFPGLKSLL